MEDPEVQKERHEITRTKTPSQLSEIHSLGEIPIPGLWEGDRGRSPSAKRGSAGERSLSIPRNTHELKEIVYNKILPESLVKPCVVRCRVSVLPFTFFSFMIIVRLLILDDFSYP